MTDKEVNNLTSSMNALAKQMEKMSAQQLIQSKNVNDQKKDFEDILKNTRGIEESYDKQNSYLKEMRKNIKDSLLSTMKLGNVISTIGSTMFAANIVKDLIDLDNKMTALSVRMGKGHAGIKELKKSVTDLQEEFGTSYENASRLVGELSEEKYIGNIKEAAAGIDLFSRATGISSSSVLELTNNLSKSGGLGTDSINSIYASMIKTQQAVGISEKGMSHLVGTINDMTMNMVAFGKTESEIKKMITGTTALVGAMENVGISASRSTQLVEQLMDPDRIEENVLLYSQLGISMQDAISGNIDESQLGAQFKDMADRIMEMGPIAGSKFARSMGMSYKEVSKMAKLQADDIAGITEKTMTPEEQALETMKSLEKATEGIGKQFETGLNKIEGKIKGLPTALLVGAAIIFPLLIKKGKQLLHKIFDKKEIQASVMDAVVPAFENSMKKAGVVVKGQATKVGNAVKGNIGQWFDSTGVGGFFNGSEANIDALVARATRSSFADNFLGAARANRSDSIGAKLTNIDAQKEKIFAGLSGLGVDAKYDEKNGSLITEGTVSDKNQKAVKALKAAYDKLNKSQIALETKKNKMLTKEQKIAKATADLEEKKKNAQEAMRSYLSEKDAYAKKELDINVQIAKLNKEKAGMTGKDLEAMEAKIDSLEKEKQATKDLVKAKKEAVKIANQEKYGAEDNLKNTNNGPDSGKWKSSLGKITAGIGNKIATAFDNTALGKNLTERAGEGRAGRWKAVGKTAADAGLGVLKKVGKGVGGILKSVGPMALVMTIFGKLLSKIREPLESMMSSITDSLAPIAESMLPAIKILMDTIAKHILPPMLKISANILKVAHAILTPLIWILRALENVPLIGPALKGIGDTLEAATGSGVTEGLLTAAKDLSENGAKMEKSSERVADSVEDQNDGPRTIQADGANFFSNGYSNPSVQASERMTSTTTYTQGSASENALASAKYERHENERSEKIEKINNNSGYLPSIFKVLEEIKNFIINNNNIFYGSEPTIASIENTK